MDNSDKQHSYPHVHSYSTTRPLSFSFVPSPCLKIAASQALAPWFSWFFIQPLPPVFSLSFGFPNPLALRRFFWAPFGAPHRAIYPDALSTTLSPCPFTFSLTSLPLCCSYLRAWLEFNIRYSLGRALGSSGSCSPHASMNFTSWLQEFHRFCCFLIFPELRFCILAPGCCLSSAVLSISFDVDWLSCLHFHSPLFSYLVPGSLFKATISVVGPIDSLLYSRGARQCGQFMPFDSSREQFSFFFVFTPCVKGCVFKCSPFFEGCVGTGDLLPMPLHIPTFKRQLLFCLPSSFVNWQAKMIAPSSFDLIYLTFHFGYSGLSLLAPCFQELASSPNEDCSQTVSFFGVLHHFCDGYFLGATEDFLYSRPSVPAL